MTKEKYDLILSQERWYFNDMVKHISNLYYGALHPDDRIFTLEEITSKVSGFLKSGYKSKDLTEGVAHPEYDEKCELDEDYGFVPDERLKYTKSAIPGVWIDKNSYHFSLCRPNTKQVCDYLRELILKNKWNAPAEFKKYFLGMEVSETYVTISIDSAPALQEAQPLEPKLDTQQQVAAFTKSMYCFIKNAKGLWDLQFDEVVLPNVKNLKGMKYIGILLQNPGEKINVYRLQEIAGEATSINDEESENDSEDDEQGYDDPTDKETSSGGINAWQASDDKAVQGYKVELRKVDGQLKAAQECKIKNMTKIQRLENDKNHYEQMIREASYKPKDPEAEKNRKRLLGCITYAITCIGKLEKLSDNYDKPISRHLRRHIRTGLLCSYYIKTDDIPPWKFKH